MSESQSPPPSEKSQIINLKSQISIPPPGFVHVDLDGLWTLAGCYGYPEADSFDNDPVYERGLPRLLKLLADLKIHATFFIIGRDADLPEKAAAIREIARRGHELANHSWSHRFGLEEMAAAERELEIERTSEALGGICGRRPLGFRAPGYTAGPNVLTDCARAGIRYDGSRLPTRAAPLLRFMAGRLRAQVRRDLDLEIARAAKGGRKEPAGGGGAETKVKLAGAGRQYGGGGGLAPDVFTPEDGSAPILRLPLAVSPGLRLPLHASLGFLMGPRFVTTGLRRLARRGHPITYLLHGMDFVGGEDLVGRLPYALARARPFKAAWFQKVEFVREVLENFKRLTKVELTRDWLERGGGAES